MSSSGDVSLRLLDGPSGRFVIEPVVVQAAMQDADEPVGQGAQSLVVGGAAGAVSVVVAAGSR
jgi:hypothetical protein